MYAINVKARNIVGNEKNAVYYNVFNSLPNDKELDQSKLKAFRWVSATLS